MSPIVRYFVGIMTVLCVAFSPVTSTQCDCSCEDLCTSYNTRETCIQYGCAKGYCWASCGLMGIIKGEWCWTTRGSMWDRNYVKCDWDWECEPHWHCAGACALFDTFNATNNNEKDNVMTNDV